ncbi:MAG: hypothetical protein H0T62_03655 [Parachlamydiaceae bacterium]|nr:hypothetical protein [Parachlamydiaceae bacterium]
MDLHNIRIREKDQNLTNYSDHIISNSKNFLNVSNDERLDEIFIRTSHRNVDDEDYNDEVTNLLCTKEDPPTIKASEARENILLLLDEFDKPNEYPDLRDIALLKIKSDTYENELKAQSSVKWVSYLVGKVVSKFFPSLSADSRMQRACEIYDSVSSKISTNEGNNLKILEASLRNRGKPYMIENLVFTQGNKVFQYTGQIINGVPTDPFFSKEVGKDQNSHLGRLVSKAESGIFKELSNLVNRLTHNFGGFLEIQLISFKMKKCWVKAHGMMLESWLFSDKNLMKKAEIKLAKGVTHRECDIKSIFNKKIFGDKLLVASRNIATKEILKNEEDKQAYLTLRQLLSNNLSAMIGFEEVALENNFKDPVEPKSAKRDGVCFSASMYLIEKMVNGDNLTEELLIHFAKDLEQGVPARVAAIQEIYQELKFKSVELEINEFTSVNDRSQFCAFIANLIYEEAVSKDVKISLNDLPMIKKNVAEFLEQRENDLDSTQKNIIYMDDIFMSIQIDSLINRFKPIDEDFQNVNPSLSSLQDLKFKMSETTFGIQNKYKDNFSREAIARLYNHEKDIEGMGAVNSTLGLYTDRESSKEHLENLSSLEEGSYEISFSTEAGGHSIVFVKMKDVGYIFDPNYGLIKCDMSSSATFLKLLSLYAPPKEKLENENDDRNYRLTFAKYRKAAQNL